MRPRFGDLRRGLGHEVLPAETRLDGHDHDDAELVEEVAQHGRGVRGTRQGRDAAGAADVGERVVLGVVALIDFDVEGKRVGAGRR